MKHLQLIYLIPWRLFWWSFVGFWKMVWWVFLLPFRGIRATYRGCKKLVGAKVEPIPKKVKPISENREKFLPALFKIGGDTLANHEELFNLRQYSGLLNKITSAVAIKCKAVINDGTATGGQKDWARQVIQAPESKKEAIMWPLLVANKDATVEQIQGATDGQIQSNVDQAISDLIGDLA